MLAFGPVPSRRLGRSLGINNIPAKTCTYSCVYCQLGRTSQLTVKRRAFYNPEKIFNEVKRKVEVAVSRNEKIDYLTFVPDGEPSLDINLGKEISLLKQIGVPIAVLTNASLLWYEDVKEDLLKANLVSLKMDSVNQVLWRKINRPHTSLSLNKILDSIVSFADDFEGILITETMLIDEIEYGAELREIASFLQELNGLKKAYIAIPTRPPAEKWVKPANEEIINLAYQIFSEKLGAEKVEYLIGYEGNAFAFTGNVKEDLLAITAVHPMRKEAIEEFLKKANAEWHIIEELLHKKLLIELEYEGKLYYMRKLPSRTNHK